MISDAYLMIFGNTPNGSMKSKGNPGERKGKNMKKGILIAAILTVTLGRITFNDHTETFYSLPMDRVVRMADEATGLTGLYNVREDGVKCYGPYVIVASHPSVRRFTVIETSLGPGLVLDRHTCQDVNLYDIATTWKE